MINLHSYDVPLFVDARCPFLIASLDTAGQPWLHQLLISINDFHQDSPIGSICHGETDLLNRDRLVAELSNVALGFAAGA